jgi:hypothetical protein
MRRTPVAIAILLIFIATAALYALAFTALLRHLKAADPRRTVIMVQVENEPGTWGSVCDYSPAAQKLLEGPVPPEVVAAMHVPSAANWQAVFWPEAEVCFHAWSVAKYVGQLAAAGKAVYPLPMYANAALRDPIKPGAPGSYESGGPTDNVIPIWKVAAPALDIVAPDVYMSDSLPYLKVLDLYHRDDNALFVPETGGGAGVARFFFSALGLQAIGFSPFGMDYTGNRGATAKPEEFLTSWAQNYQLIGPMVREIARLAQPNWQREPRACRARPGGPARRQSVSGCRVLLPRRVPPQRSLTRQAPAVPACGRGRLRQRRLQADPHLERRPDRLGPQPHCGAADAARLAGHLLAAFSHVS